MSLIGIMDALASQISDEITVDNLQVHGRLVWNPTPPAVDMYPDEELFQETTDFKQGKAVTFTVRARVNTPDSDAAQDTLLNMMDVEAEESVAAAILSDRTLSGTVDDLKVEGPSNFGVFPDPAGNQLLGCTWRVTVLP